MEYLVIAEPHPLSPDTDLAARIRARIPWEPDRPLHPRPRVNARTQAAHERTVAAQAVLHTWNQAYMAKFGMARVWNPKEVAMAKDLVKKHDLALLRAAVDYFIMFVDSSHPLVHLYGHTLPTFIKILPMLYEAHGRWIQQRAAKEYGRKVEASE